MNLECKVQYYDWGSRDPNCQVYTLSKQNEPRNACQVCDGKLLKPHAEFWVGTHVNGPSIVKKFETPLHEYLAKNPEKLGQKILDKFGTTDMPFLLKVLSVSKPLSIQAHPNKSHAEVLHATYPDLYKDPNHKPEMIIPLTKFQMLRGFRPIHNIKHFLKIVPELRTVLGPEVSDQLLNCCLEDGEEALKKAYRTLMTASPEVITQALDSILARVANLDEASRGACQADLLETLHSHFPGDVGCLSIYFLQDYTMEPGEVAFLPANMIHAYLSGECVEIMACSDNVVRGRLTPKHKDVETLWEMLDYSTPDSQSPNFDKIAIADHCVKYVPHGIEDFSIIHIKVILENFILNIFLNDSIVIVDIFSIWPEKLVNSLNFFDHSLLAKK
ncbi:hypothetical protein B566_EDAN008509 [Ephemera danica]|nr:hypothetical protein B566_EDAN008509 [Ephemera danica]